MYGIRVFLLFFIPLSLFSITSLITTKECSKIFWRFEDKMLWIVDYLNPHDESSDVLIVEADNESDAHSKAIEELKILKIPKRYIIKMEEF